MSDVAADALVDKGEILVEYAKPYGLAQSNPEWEPESHRNRLKQCLTNIDHSNTKKNCDLIGLDTMIKCTKFTGTL